MRVSRVQAEENRQRVIDTASRLFRESGFDGIGLKDLMAAAGLTQGAFYKQFDSKDDLAVQATGRAFACSAQRWQSVIDTAAADPLEAALALYLSLGHRDDVMDGCPLVALGADAARKGEDLRSAFEAGVIERLDLLRGLIVRSSGPEAEASTEADREADAMAALSTMVGGLLLARVVKAPELSARILDAAADGVRRLSAPGRAQVSEPDDHRAAQA